MPLDAVPELDLPESSLADDQPAPPEEQDKYRWRPGMSREEKDARESWIAGGRGRSGLRIVIVTGEFGVPCCLRGRRRREGRSASPRPALFTGAQRAVC